MVDGQRDGMVTLWVWLCQWLIGWCLSGWCCVPWSLSGWCVRCVVLTGWSVAQVLPWCIGWWPGGVVPLEVPRITLACMGTGEAVARWCPATVVGMVAGPDVALRRSKTMAARHPAGHWSCFGEPLPCQLDALGGAYWVPRALGHFLGSASRLLTPHQPSRRLS
jgi:hypothetical protein